MKEKTKRCIGSAFFMRFTAEFSTNIVDNLKTLNLLKYAVLKGFFLYLWDCEITGKTTLKRNERRSKKQGVFSGQHSGPGGH
jgi:hypothetical protein